MSYGRGVRRVRLKNKVPEEKDEVAASTELVVS